MPKLLILGKPITNSTVVQVFVQLTVIPQCLPLLLIGVDAKSHTSNWHLLFPPVRLTLAHSSGRIIQKEFVLELSKVYKQPAFWSSSYYVASTGGAPIERVKAYIKSQEMPQ